MSDTVDTTVTQPVGNTKKSLRARYWSFTWNNYPENYNDTLTLHFRDSKKFAYQEEMGEEKTPHIQGYVEWENARSFDSLKKIDPKIHWEKSRSIAAIKYCLKESSRVGKQFVKGIKINKPLITDFRPWQIDLNQILSEPANARHVIWIIDKEGGQGKTHYCKHLCMSRDDVIYLGGKASDIKHAITAWTEEGKEFNIALFDFTRSLEHYVSYEAIESVKNNIFFSGKYESKQFIKEGNPHVMVFANFAPDTSKLSADRWVVRDISVHTDMMELESRPDNCPASALDYDFGTSLSSPSPALP